MASPRSFRLDLVTPERAVLSCAASFVAFPAFDGEMGILAHRAPLVARLGTGVLRVQSPEGDRRFFVDGGFAEMAGDRLTVLTGEARDATALDAQAIERELAAARQITGRDEAALARRARLAARVRAQRRLLGA